jgi:DNA-binding CsgD family transcriptional regulator/PAS domain-containing protein
MSVNSIKNLVSLERLESLLAQWSKAFGCFLGLVDVQTKEMIISVGWQDTCLKFHRVFPEAEKNCRKSIVKLTNNLKGETKESINKCKNGMIDGATPVIINGEHIADFIVGQVLFEKPDISFFDRLAVRHGYDRKAYLEAVARVQVLGEDRFREILLYLSHLAEMLGRVGKINQEKNNKVRELLEETGKRKKIEEVLTDSEVKFSLFMDNLPAGVFIKDIDSRVLYVNKYLQDEFNAEDWLHKTARDNFPEDIASSMIADDRKALRSGFFQATETVSLPGGIEKNFQTCKFRIDQVQKTPLIGGIAMDITKHVQAEEELRNHRDKLDLEVEKRTEKLKQRENELQIKTNALEETNIALRVMLSQRELDKKEMGDRLQGNVKELILPYLQKIKQLCSPKNREISTLLQILEININRITSPFVNTLSSKYYNLTPAEIKIASLVRDGLGNKEIAELLFLSKNTILFHRSNIRKKMGLLNKKVNLRTHLLSLEL